MTPIAMERMEGKDSLVNERKGQDIVVYRKGRRPEDYIRYGRDDAVPRTQAQISRRCIHLTLDQIGSSYPGFQTVQHYLPSTNN